MAMDNSQASQTDDLSLADKAEEVRAYIVAVRGGAPFLSAADGRLLVTWLEQGIPVGRILAAIDEVSEKRRKKRSRRRLTLTACKRSIEKTPQPSPAPQATAKPITVTLHAYAAELNALEVPPTLQGERARLVARIGSLEGSPERVATDAIAACRTFQEAAWGAMQANIKPIRAEAEAELSALRSVLKPDQFEAYIDEVARDIVKRRTPLVSAKAVWDRVSAL